MATYLMHGLGSGVTSISSSEGWAGQPTLDFPSSSSDRPSKRSTGVKFEKRRFTTSGYPTGIGEIQAFHTTDGKDAKLKVNGAEVGGIKEKFEHDEWILIGFGWGKDKGYMKTMCEGGGGGMGCAEHKNNASHVVSSWTTPGSYYVGNFNDNCQSSCEFYIHSIRVFTSELPGIEEDLEGAVYNEWYSD